MRVSCTAVEAYRLWREPEQEWFTEDALLSQIRGEFMTNRQIEIGTAFGKVLETPDRYRVEGGYVCRGFSFSHETMGPALALMDTRAVYEAKGTKQYGDCTVVAKADQLRGSHLKEHKTTLSSFDFDKYAASCQWRFMVDIFEATKVTYHVFLLNDHGNDVVELKSIESFDLYPYAGLHEDCADLVREFAGYVTAKGLDGLLRARQEAA